MNREYGLFIIWSNARNKEEQIHNFIDNNFNILNIFEIEWNKEIFSDNLTRFYGENLPKNSFKEKHCGNDKFLLYVVEDEKPVYKYRKTSKGMKLVNTSFFDSKEILRYWTGGGHKIHATNDVQEFKHDLMLLLDVSIEDYLKKYIKSKDIISIKKDVIGANGWNSLDEVFYVLNETIKYVVLRNFENLPEQYVVGNHGDVDILCDNYYNMQKILNSKEESKISSRVRNYIDVSGKKLFLDLRYVSDNYYCNQWEEHILDNRKKYKCFYIPDNEDLKYSLLYHALIHKKNISPDYITKFKDYFNTDSTVSLCNILKGFMNEKKYCFIDPKDISVFFNENNNEMKSRISKKIYFLLFPLINRIVK